MKSIKGLNELKELGAFVPDELVKREIEFKIDGEEYKALIHVRRLSLGTHERIFLDGEPDEDSRSAKLISSAIRLGEDGKEELSYVDAYQLHRNLANAMLNAIADVNGGLRKN